MKAKSDSRPFKRLSVRLVLVFCFTQSAFADRSQIGHAHILTPAPWTNPPAVVSSSAAVQEGLVTFDVHKKAVTDFLIQSVCVDEHDRPYPADPYLCDKKRKLRIGEDLPYSRTSEQKLEGGGHQSTVAENSYPVAFGERVHFVNSRVGIKGARVFRDDSPGNGFDIVGDEGHYTSIVGTRDPQKTSRDFTWWGMFGNLGGGWVLFGHAVFRVGYSKGVYDICGGSGLSSSCDNWTQSFTEWRPVEKLFSSGKRILSVKSNHYNYQDPNLATGYESFYQSELYGATRWESWSEVQGPHDGSDECNGATTRLVNGEWPIKGDHLMYRNNCKDWSHVVLHKTPLNGFHIPLSSVFTTSPNLLENADFASSSNDISPWKLSQGEPQLQASIEEDSETRNRHMKIVKSDNKLSSAVLQVVRVDSVPAAHAVADAGFLVRGPKEAKVLVKVEGVDAIGRSVVNEQIEIQLKNQDWSAVRFHFDVNSGGTVDADHQLRLTFKIFPENAGSYLVDEAFLALL